MIFWIIMIAIWSGYAIAFFYFLWHDVYRRKPKTKGEIAANTVATTGVAVSDTIAFANAQAAQWHVWSQAAAEDDTEIEAATLEPDQGDRARVQALMILKVVAHWLEAESMHYAIDQERAIRQLAHRLQQDGLEVLMEESDRP